MMSETTARPTDKYLTFAQSLVGKVIDGDEDATIRVGLERDIERGDELELRTPSGTVFGTATVEDIYETRVGLAYHDTVVVDGRSHPSEGKQDLLDRLRTHYDQEIWYDTGVTVVYFDYAGSVGKEASSSNE